MSTVTVTSEQQGTNTEAESGEHIGLEKIPVIDVDVHPSVDINSDVITSRLSARSKDYLELVGLRNISTERTIPPQRKYTHRLDAIDSNGRSGSVPGFTRAQLLDEFDMSAAVLGDAGAVILSKGNTNFPVHVGEELCRAHNDVHVEVWINADSRFYPLINVLVEQPDWAAAEIARCRESKHGARFPGVLLEPRTECPIGNPRYWPIFEACEHYGIPLVFHVSPGRRMTPCGGINYYYEWHAGFTLRMYTVVSSLIFEGVFERFPGLRVALIEFGTAWAVPFAWRMDSAWAMLQAEVPHLTRKPSEYLRDHFWFSTQPMEEPERQRDFVRVLNFFQSFFGPHHLMFASDYPHWDFDSPYQSVPPYLPIDMRRRILGENASALFGIPLRSGRGISASGRPR